MDDISRLSNLWENIPSLPIGMKTHRERKGKNKEKKGCNKAFSLFEFFVIVIIFFFRFA